MPRESVQRPLTTDHYVTLDTDSAAENNTGVTNRSRKGL
jgi:hypothetical protein